MNSEKSYDSLPNFTAADCKYLIMLKEVMFSMFVHVALVSVVCVFNLQHLKNENSTQHH